MTHAMVQKTERIIGHVVGHLAALVVGLALMVLGLGLGVTMIMLPVGIVVGLSGVLLFIWGLVGHLGQKDAHG